MLHFTEVADLLSKNADSFLSKASIFAISDWESAKSKISRFSAISWGWVDFAKAIIPLELQGLHPKRV